MKFGEFAIKYLHDTVEDIGISVLNQMPFGVDEARIEVHSLDNPPWPTERPKGWGVGWWCEYQQEEWLCTSWIGLHQVRCIRYDDEVFCDIVLKFTEITSFGPRAEVPR